MTKAFCACTALMKASVSSESFDINCGSKKFKKVLNFQKEMASAFYLQLKNHVGSFAIGSLG